MLDRPAEAEKAMLTRLLDGDEAAFAGLVDDLHGGLVAFASTFTSSPALAEDIVQETWLAVIRGLAGFEGRASIKTWIYSILVRRARTMAVKDARQSVSHSNGSHPSAEVEWEPGQGRRGLWEQSPAPWAVEDPAAIYEGREALQVLQSALDALPDTQRQVVLLRDVEGLPATDVCNILALSETNQRVILHRGRSRLRKALDRYVQGGVKPTYPPARSTEKGI